MEAMDPLDRKAAALHLAKVAYHVSALAKLFDPSVKASKVKGGAGRDAAEGGAAAGKPPRPKREPTPYTMYIKEQMPAFKEQVRPCGNTQPCLCLGPCSERARPRARTRTRRAATRARIGVAATGRSGRSPQRGRTAPALSASRASPFSYSFCVIAALHAKPRRRAAHRARRAAADARAGAASRRHALQPACAARAHFAVTCAAPGDAAEGPLPSTCGAVAAGPVQPEGACAALHVEAPGSRAVRARRPGKSSRRRRRVSLLRQAAQRRARPRRKRSTSTTARRRGATATARRRRVRRATACRTRTLTPSRNDSTRRSTSTATWRSELRYSERALAHARTLADTVVRNLATRFAETLPCFQSSVVTSSSPA